MAKFKGMNCLWYLVRSWCLGLSSWPVILSGLAGMTPWTTWESLVCSVRRWNHPVGWIRTSYLDFALRRWMWPWPHSRVPLSPFWNMNLFRVSVIRRSFGLGTWGFSAKKTKPLLQASQDFEVLLGVKVRPNTVQRDTRLGQESEGTNGIRLSLC